VLPTGQVVGLIDQWPTVADIIDGVMAEADEVLQRFSSPTSTGGGASP
jgi:NAD(P)H-dependent flavin oxidoreductase YrpB (nitropropane dioxygenase family)